MSLLQRTLLDKETGEHGKVLTVFKNCYHEDRPEEKLTALWVRFPSGSRRVLEREVGERYELVEEEEAEKPKSRKDGGKWPLFDWQD
jgi:hypothetical protein